jgi:putrescine transport system substrate-binding protein
MGLHKLTQALLLVLAPLCVQAADSEKPVVNLYIWGEYLAPDTLKNFEAKTGIHVVADHFDSLETVETKLLTGRSGYDLVLTAGQHLSRAIERRRSSSVYRARRVIVGRCCSIRLWCRNSLIAG